MDDTIDPRIDPARPGFAAAWLAAHGQPRTLADIEACLLAAVARLGTDNEHAEALEPSEVPTAAEVAAVVASLFTDHGGKGVRLRARRRTLDDFAADNFAASVDGHRRFLRSGGDLTGLFLAQMRGGKRSGAAETLAVVLLTLAGQRATALDAWGSIIHRRLSF